MAVSYAAAPTNGMGAGSLQSQSFSAAGGSGGGAKPKSRSFFSRLSRFRRVPSLFHIWLIVLCSTLSLTLAGVLVQDVEVGFFNNGDQCLKEGDSALPSCKKAQQKVQNITGYVAIAGSLLSFFFSPMLGALSDAYGRKIVLLATELITLTTYGLLVMHSWFGWSLWPYICMSCTTAAFSPLSFAFAYASDITAPAERAVAFALLMASLEVSMIVGPILATYSSISDSVVFAMAACSILLCLLFTLFLTPESLPKHTQRAKRRQIVHEDALARERAIKEKMAKMMSKQQRIQEGGGALSVVSSSDADHAASSEGRPSEFSMPPDALPRVSVAYPSLTASSQQQHDASNPNNSRRRPSAHFTTPLLVCQGGPARPTASASSSGEMEEFSRSMSSSSATGLASASNDHSAAASGKLRSSLTGPGMVSVAPSFASMPVPKSGAVLRVLVFNNPIKPLMILNRTWFLRTLAFVAVLLFFCLMGMLRTMYLYLKYRFGMTRQQHAVMNVVNGSCGLLVQAVLARALSKRLSNFAVLVLGLSFILMANVMYAVQWALYPWLFFILPVYAVGMLCFPALTALKSNSVANDEQGIINGALSGVRSLGQGLGPLAFNSVLTATQDTRWQSAPFIMGALAAASAIIGALAIPRDQRGPSSAEVAAAAAAASDGAAGADGGSSDAAPPPLPPLIVPPPAASAAYEDGLRDEDELEGFADDDDDGDDDDLRDGGDAIINRPGRRVLTNRTTEAVRDAEAAAMA